MDEKTIYLNYKNHIEKSGDTLDDNSFPSIFEMMVEKMRHHQKQIEKHEKEIEDIKFLLDTYESKFSYRNSFLDLNTKVEIEFDIDQKTGVQGAHKTETNIRYYGGGFAVALPAKESGMYWKLNGENSKRGKNFWKTVSLNLIQNLQKLIRSVDILNAIGIDMDKEERRIEMIVLSGCLSELCDEGTIQKIDFPGKKGFYYGLPYMFDKTGFPLKKYFNINDL